MDSKKEEAAVETLSSGDTKNGRYLLGCTIFSKCSQIKPTFLHSMCIAEIRSHAKFQVSSFKDLTWPPLFVNQS